MALVEILMRNKAPTDENVFYFTDGPGIIKDSTEASKGKGRVMHAFPYCGPKGCIVTNNCHYKSKNSIDKT